MSLTTLIHPTAVVSPGADLHPTVKVGPYAVIGEKVSVGPETEIGAHVVIDGHTKIGAHNRIFPGAAIGMESQDLKYDGSMSRVEIGDNNLIREYVTINRATNAGAATLIGHNNLFMAYSHVAHNCVVEDQVIIANSVALAGHVYIESGARISGIVGVHQFVRVGQMAMIGGLSRIDRDVPPYTLVNGNPSRVRGLNQIGLQRAGLTQIEHGRLYRELKQAFRLAYRSGESINIVIEKMDQWQDNELVDHFKTFLAASQQADRRGLTPGRKTSRSSEADSD